MKWEYRSLWFRTTELDEQLNGLGAEGWEAVAVMGQRSPKVIDGTFLVLMKRPV